MDGILSLTRKKSGDVLYDHARFAVGFVLVVAVHYNHWYVDRVDTLSRPRTASGVTMIELYEQQVVETRRTNVALERIATALDMRAQG